jgi:hypothetical protein
MKITNTYSSFPDQVVPDEVKKSLDYGKQVGQAIEGDWFSGTRSGVENRFNSTKPIAFYSLTNLLSIIKAFFNLIRYNLIWKRTISICYLHALYYL